MTNYIFILKRIFIAFSFCVLVVGCKHKTVELNKAHQELIEEIKLVEYDNIKKLGELSKRLTSSTDSFTKKIGEYYLTKAQYYNQTISVNDAIQAFLKMYDSFKTNELEFVRRDIDMLLINHYYGISNFKMASDRLQMTHDYLFKPENELFRFTLIHSINRKATVANKTDREHKIKDLEKVLDKYGADWNYYISNLNFSLIYHKSFSDKYLTKEIVAEFNNMIIKNKENNLSTLNTHIYNDLIYVISDFNQKLEYSDKALQIVEEKGFRLHKATHHRTQGHLYSQSNTNTGWAKAKESYLKALQADSIANIDRSIGIGLVYYGWSLYKLDTKSNVDVALKYIDAAISLAKKDVKSIHFSLLNLALLRKKWLLRDLKKKKEVDELKKQIKEVNFQNKFNRERINNYYLNHSAAILGKESELEVLTLRESAVKTRFLWVSIAWIGTILMFILFLYFYNQRALILKKLNNKNQTINKQNVELNEVNNVLRKKEEELISELKNKLLLLSDNYKTKEELKKYIIKTDDISSDFRHQLLKKVDSESNLGLINELDFQFIELHENFVKKLSSLHPDLTSQNLKLSIYLKMGLSTKEISSLQFTSYEAIKVARSRLRKKLQIESSKTSLTVYLNSI